MANTERRDFKERDKVQECVRMMMWMWCAREEGGGVSAVGGILFVGRRLGEIRGIGVGVCACRWRGRGGGGIVVGSVQPASRSNERR